MQLNKKDVILFDLDGTVINSQQGIFNAIFYTFDKLKMTGVDCSSETMKKFMGPSIASSFKRLYGFSEEAALNAVDIYREYYSIKGFLECTVYDGLEQLFTLLKQQGKKIGLATKKPEIFAEKIMIEKNLMQYFDVVCGSSLSESDDDKSHIISRCAKLLAGNELERVVHIGDTSFDVTSAKLALVDCIGVLYGFGDLEQFVNPAPVAIAKSVADLTKLLT